MIFKFWDEPDDRFLFLDHEYKLNLAFGNVMKVFELDPTDERTFIKQALFLLLGKDFQKLNLPINMQSQIFIEIQEKFLSMKEDVRVRVDAFGNELDPINTDIKSYDLVYDAKEIYASFMQAYHIDLIDVKDTLHWYKFNALLAGLPSNTSFKQLIEIRSWKPQKGDSEEYKRKMRNLQLEVKLPDGMKGGEDAWQTDQ